MSGRRRPTRSVVAALGAAEKAALLDELLRANPHLRDDAERLARTLLADVDADGVAEEIAWTLRSIPAEALASRAGRQRGRGYVEPTEAAWEILDETLRPSRDDIARLAELGMADAARATGAGVLRGLYECRGVTDGDLLLSWAADFPLDEADSTLAQLRERGLAPSHDDLSVLAPAWMDWLARDTP